jgi:hypothetical protein
MLCIMGPTDMHKTCTQELLVTAIFGGRSADPDQFFSQGTAFNGDFIDAETLIITDVKANSKNENFSSKVKEYCGTSKHRIHPKNRDAFNTEVFWRISQSCNDTYPGIAALPDLSDETVADKILLVLLGGEIRRLDAV